MLWHLERQRSVRVGWSDFRPACPVRACSFLSEEAPRRCTQGARRASPLLIYLSGFRIRPVGTVFLLETTLVALAALTTADLRASATNSGVHFFPVAVKNRRAFQAWAISASLTEYKLEISESLFPMVTRNGLFLPLSRPTSLFASTSADHAGGRGGLGFLTLDGFGFDFGGSFSDEISVRSSAASSYEMNCPNPFRIVLPPL